ncbi:hypothetical protein AK830_g469 [Neonectria ditissima]|uniref:Zn(2)-C6 fungal-type domain-containing protein n=1 Tax=Neonectria ditissima TaxID=78410 RepID=A0A0P7BLG7_9HYPO|nr:hypothetical protein AK830_g469 [Neonectria ditissima]
MLRARFKQSIKLQVPGPFLEAQPATIASQLSIQSIISPPDPEVDDLPAVPLSQSTPKRKFDQVLTTSEAPTRLRRTESLEEPRPRSEGLGIELSGGHADEQTTSALPATRDGKRAAKMRPPMRSSIACMRCRRSKIKCDNDGGTSPCDTCIKGGHQCQYPDPSLLTAAKRNDPPIVNRQDKDMIQERKRIKKVEEVPVLDNEKAAVYAEEVLAYPFLTPELWDQLLNIYKLHFATELSALHLPTLKEKMRLKQGTNYEPSTELNLVLLGILTLTSRFHPDLVKYVSHLSTATRARVYQPKPDPAAASEFFANVLTTALGPLKSVMSIVTVERVQVFLMLGLFEWGQRTPSEGSAAWMYIGIAIRMAQVLKLGFDDRMATGQGYQGRGSNLTSRARGSSSEIGIIREIRRRTMFSCLILDRMMACGNERVLAIQPDTIRIQLPCTDMAFDLALDVNTGFLSFDGDILNQSVNDDSVLSRFIQLVEIWSKISNYSSTGGRLREVLPPWDKQSIFGTLRDKLYQFLQNLPDTFTLSRQNFYRHDNHQSASMYVSLHMLVSVCVMMLHREYLPFLPLRFSRPEGPLMSPSFPPHQTPVGFWEDITEAFFEAGRDIVDLVEICRDKLPQSALTFFSVWSAGFSGIYAHHFPFMDTKLHMISQEDLDRRADGSFEITKGTATGLAYQALHKMAATTQGAQNYFKYLEEIDRYYRQAGAVFLQGAENSDYTREASDRQLSIRLGGDGVGFDEWNPQAGRAPRDYAMMVDDEPRWNQYDESDRSRGSTTDRGSPLGHSESYQAGADYTRTPRSNPIVPFTVVNNVSLLRSNSSGSPPLGMESRRDGVPGGDHQLTPKAAPAHSGSMLLLPETEPETPSGEMPEFTLDQLGVVESQRIGQMLNDVAEFAGAGTLGGGHIYHGGG